jgi:hypothetical protein
MTLETQFLADKHKNVAGLSLLSVCISCLHSYNVMILDRVVRKQNSTVKPDETGLIDLIMTGLQR